MTIELKGPPLAEGAAFDGAEAWLPAWTPPSFWTEHAPFARWLVRQLAPRTFVELGAHWGYSYFAILEAAAEVGLPTTGVAVDNWRGDVQNGFYGENVYKAVQAHNASHYAGRSALFRMDFAEARKRFRTGDVDLLHIDGLHTYDAVREDFENWKGTLSETGVVLFHDTAVEGRGYEVGRFWREVSRGYPAFEFTHGNGLGVLCVGRRVPNALLELCRQSRDPRQTAEARARFARAGAIVERLHRGRLAASPEFTCPEPVEEPTAAVAAPSVEPPKRLVLPEPPAPNDPPNDPHVPLGRRPALRSLVKALRGAKRAHFLADSILFDRVHVHAQRPEVFTARDPARAFTFNPAFALVDPNALFSSRAYLRRRPDVAVSGVHPMLHYLEAGWRERVAPHPLFDIDWYLAKNPDVAASGQEPFSHWIAQGWRDDRDPHPLVSVWWLHKQWRDRARAAGGVEPEPFRDPLTRYLCEEDGWKAGVTPHPLFDSERYRAQLEIDPDIEPLQHFLEIGGPAGVSPHALFDADWYRKTRKLTDGNTARLLVRYLDEAETGASDEPSPYFSATFQKAGQKAERRPSALFFLAGRLDAGADPHPLIDLAFIARQLGLEERSDRLGVLNTWIEAAASGHACDPHPLFSSRYYLAQNPDIGARGIDPLAHYLGEGWKEGRRPHPLFDPAWYTRAHPDVDAAGQEPLSHYVAEGAREGRQPCVYFDPEWYAKTSGKSGSLTDYLDGDWRRAGTSPHPLFDKDYYLAQNEDVARAGIEPLTHFVSGGWREHRAPHPLFDVRWHLDHEPAARASGLEPLARFLETGAAAGEGTSPYFDAGHYKRSVGEAVANPLLSYLKGDHPAADPHSLFDETFYVERYRTSLRPFEHGLAHYVRTGAQKEQAPHLLFDPVFYRQTYPDIDAEGHDPFLHYWTRGGREGRQPHPLFDGKLYLERYPDVADAGLNPLAHYLDLGASEGRDPHALFDTPYYQARLRDRNGEQICLRAERLNPIGPATHYVYTSAALNYAHKARLLAQSLKHHHPNFRSVIVLSEKRTPETEGLAAQLTEFDEIWFLEDLGLPNLWSWAFEHTIVELCTAVKGWTADLLLQRPAAERVIYLDPDVVLLDRLTPVLDALDRASIVVTPHQCDPETTRESIIDNEISSLLVGVYNLGFLGLRADEEGRRFARWWRDRLLDFCFEDSASGVYTDQRWVDFAPAFFDQVEILRHPGCNFARWNISQRWVTGAVPNQLVVNGQRAVFFHCSGAGTGRLSLSEAKHAHDMPSFKELVSWYEAQTGALDLPGFSRCLWSLGAYDTGQPISLTERRAWRARRLMGQDDRNPFVSADRRIELGESAVETISNNRLLTLTPLEHYIEIGSTMGMPPNPFFDPSFYLQHNPDVASNKVEPLWHYADRGWREGRSPHPKFDPHFYQAQLPGPERGGDALQHYLQKGARLGLRTNRRFNRDHDADALRCIFRNVGRDRPVLLFIAHGLGGGVRVHMDQLAQLVRSEVDVLLLEPDTSNGLLRLQALAPALQTSLWFDPTDQFPDLFDLIRQTNVARVHVHHWMGTYETILQIHKELSLPLDVTLHDYYALSPQPFLTGDRGKFVGERLDEHEDELIRHGDKAVRVASLAAWQSRSAALLTAAERLLAPSLDLSRRVTQQFGCDVSIQTVRHPEPYMDQAVAVRRELSGVQPLRIGLIGAISVHKGLPIIVRCAQLTKEGGLPLEFACLGTLALPESDLVGLPIEQTGPYADEQATMRLEKLDVDCIWFPTQWPETHSYTLSHAMRSGLPVIAGRLGAFEERLEGRALSWLPRWDLDAEEWIAYFLRLRSDVFAAPQAREEPLQVDANAGKLAQHTGPARPRAASDFYQSEYLAPLFKSTKPVAASPIVRVV